MAMDIATPYAAISTALVTSIKSAWGLTDGQVRRDMPTTSPTVADLPQAFVQLGSYENGQSGAKGARDSVHPMPFTVTGRFAFPTDKTIEEAKIEKAQSLLNLLTAGYPRYAGWAYRLSNLDFDVEDLNETERFYSVSLTMTLEVITSG